MARGEALLLGFGAHISGEGSAVDAPSAAAVLGVNVVAIGVTGRRVAVRLFGEPGDGLERSVALLLSCTVQVIAVLTVLGWFGGINVAAVTAADVAIAAVALRVLPALSTVAPVRWSPSWWLGALLVVGGFVIVVAFAAGPYSTEPDTMRYHAVNAVHWLQTHGITTLPFSEPGDPSAEQPGNGELLGLFLLLPTHDDTLAYLGNVAMAVLCLAALGAGARQLGADWRVAVLAGVAVLAVPIIERSQLHSMSTDIVGGAMLIGALSLALALRSRPPTMLGAALLGSAVGVAMGTKYVDVIPALLVAAFIAVLLRREWRGGQRAVFAACAVGLCATWYVRDWALTGNPLYPLHVALGPISLFPVVRVNLYGNLVTPIALHVLRRRWDLVASWVRVAAYVVGPALLLTLGAVLARRPAYRDRWVSALRWLTIALLLAYTVTPFTGAGPQADTYQLAGAMRFLLPALLAGTLLVVSVLPPRLSVPLVVLVLAYDLDVDITGQGRPDLYLSASRLFAGAVIALLVGAVWAVGVAWRRRPRVALAGGVTTTLAGVALVAVSLAWLRPADDHTLVDAARALTGRPDSAVVVMNVFDARQLFGPHLDVPLTAVGDGSVGRQMPIADPTALTRAIEAQAPVVVAIGDDGTPDPRPAGWRPPASWRYLGMQLDAAIYVVQPSQPAAR